MFCPKCKAEYREGFTVCADCGVPLVETLSNEPEFDPVFFFETVGDCAWELPALLRRAGVACYLYGGDGVFIRMEEEPAVPGRLYVDSRDLPKAKACLDLLSGPPVPVDEEDLTDAYDEYMEENDIEPEPEIDSEREATGDVAWKLFLVFLFIVLGFIVSLFFRKWG